MIKSKLIIRCFLIIFGLNLISNAFSQQKKQLLKDKIILITYGGWAGHEPKQCIEVFMPWLIAEGAKVDTTSNLDKYADEKYMQTVDLIIQNISMMKITKEQEKGLLTAVRNGTGIAGWHGGLADSFRESVAYHFMIGGQWVAHPGGIIDYEVNITDKKDPIVKGLPKSFKIHSEQYYMHIDPNVKVLATTTFTGKNSDWIEGCVIPVIWKKTYGKGRVFYSSLGHVAAEFNVPEVLEIMKRGISWASQSKYETKENWVSPVYPRNKN
jgi:type 1 glutamine amidotransferase